MNILILHNNNLPLSIRTLFNRDQEDLVFRSEVINKRESDKDEYDTFLDKVLLSKMDQEYELIILPISLNELNPLEYSGLRCAAHIRLDKRFKNVRTPILFLAPEGIEEVMRLSKMGEFLLTPSVFISSCNTKESLLAWIEEKRLLIEGNRVSDIEYETFLDRFEVKPPINFADEHHSITNIWTILRWNEMLQRTDSADPFLSEDVKDFSCSLYYKWLQAQQSAREPFRPKKKETSFIGTIADKKIVHIDDDVNRGLGDVLENVFRSSKANYFPYKDFDSTYTQEELETRIKAFIDKNDDADCYLVDLRLHETDNIPFDENNDEAIKDVVKNFTGHRIARYIYEKNPGNQIVIFTASNKIWNYVAAEKYFSGYVIKENPEYIMTKAGSRSVFLDFANAIQRACRNSWLKSYFQRCDGRPYLEDFFEILRQDDENSAKIHDINMRSAALNLIVFIESSIKERFRMDGMRVVKVPNGELAGDASHVYIRSEQDPNGGKATPREMTVSDLYPTPRNEWFQATGTDIFLLCAALSQVIGISTENVNKVIELKNIRNLSIAHGHGPQKIELKFLVTIFDNVVQPLLARI